MKNGESSMNNTKKYFYVGEGLLAQIQPPAPVTLKVEDLYESFSPNMWPLLDDLFEDRPDLHDRIEKFKKTYKQ